MKTSRLEKDKKYKKIKDVRNLLILKKKNMTP